MKARNIAFYKFVAINDPQALCAQISQLAKGKLRGTVLIALEGINGMLSGSEEDTLLFEKNLLKDQRFGGILFKESFSDGIPFKKLLVKVKSEIVTLKNPKIDPTKKQAPYITPQELFEAYERNEDVAIIDVRNDFEVKLGAFKGALNPETKSFSQFSEFVKNLSVNKNKKIITYCTGGIRCEKGALVLKAAGFKNVFQLQGGILEYFKQIKGAPYFEGNCFVFDEREILTPRLEPAPKV